MSQAILIACLPWLATLVFALLGVGCLVKLRGRDDSQLWQRLRTLHRDEQGAVQSLSFVLTVPLFIMFMLLIVQASQVMLGLVVVHYAAFAAARSAMVWIPASTTDLTETANCISTRSPDSRGNNGTNYVIGSSGMKYQRIRSAAVLACAPLAPSRNVGVGGNGNDPRAELLMMAVPALAPFMESNTQVPVRLANKIAYSEQATHLTLKFFHPDNEPPLQHYYEFVDGAGNWRWIEFSDNELGWQDAITATVTHDFALLPGPARFLAKPMTQTSVGDPTAARISRRGNVYVLPLTASATLGNEGEKSVMSYVHQLAR